MDLEKILEVPKAVVPTLKFFQKAQKLLNEPQHFLEGLKAVNWTLNKF